MDLGTGRIYETREAALAAGVNPDDLIEVERTADGRYRLPSDKVVLALGGNPHHSPHQGRREMERRAKRFSQR